MRILVAGGSGLIGGRLVRRLRDLGHDALAGSSRSGVNAFTGEGLDAAMAGTDVVVDVMNSPSFEESAVVEFFQTTTRNLLAAGSAAGVRHHVALSVVGTDRLRDRGYFRGKSAQEQVIQASTVPYTILRATQFHEFLGSIADAGTVDGSVRVPPVLMQPIAADDVVGALVDCALGRPVNGIVDLAGPEALAMADAVRQWLTARGDRRQVVVDPDATYFGIPVEERALIPSGTARLGATRLEDWFGSVS